MISTIEEFYKAFESTAKHYKWNISSTGKIRTRKNNRCPINALLTNKYKNKCISNCDFKSFEKCIDKYIVDCIVNSVDYIINSINYDNSIRNNIIKLIQRNNSHD